MIDRSPSSGIARAVTTRSVTAMALLVASAIPAAGINTATGPNGARVQILWHANTFGLSGNNVNLGQVEQGRPLDGDIVGEVGHPNVNPGGGGAIGVRRVVAGPAIAAAAANANLSEHAQSVAGALVSNHATNRAPSFGGTHYSAAYTFAGAGTQDDAIVATEWVRSRPGGVPLINYSFGKGITAAEHATGGVIQDGQSLLSLYVDYAARTHDILFTQAGLERGVIANSTPDDAYNNLVVGFTQQGPGPNPRFDRLNPSSLQSLVFPQGGAAATRSRIDMVAPGTNLALPSLSGGFRQATGSSFSAPLVASTAGLIQEYATTTGRARGHLLLKTTLLNSASKHVLDRNGVAWPQAYRTRNPVAATGTSPLDPDLGIGQLNGLAAIRQYETDNRNGISNNVGLRSGTVEEKDDPDGEDVKDYTLNVNQGPLHQGTLVTATITWDRVVTNAAGGANPLLTAGNYTSAAPPNLSLELINAAGDVVAQSNSPAENVEHIYFNVPAQGDYRLRVRNNSDKESDYAIAWGTGSTDGLAFSIDRNAEGIANPFNVNFSPNDVYALGRAGPANFQTEGEIFVSGRDGKNMHRISGALRTDSQVGPHYAVPAARTLLDNTGATKGVMGLQPGDNIVGMSWGTDGTGGSKGVLLFSVDPGTVGGGGSHVNRESVGGIIATQPAKPFPNNQPATSDQAAGDIFKTHIFAPWGAYATNAIAPAPLGTNRLWADDGQLGLQAGAATGSLLGGPEDDLDALETTSPLESVDTNGDGIHEKHIFFLLDNGSPSIGAGGASPDDIFVSSTPGLFNIYATGAQVLGGLDPTGVALDGIAVSDVTGVRDLTSGFLNNVFLARANKIVEPGIDTALISFVSGTAPQGANSASVYFTDFARPFNPGTHFLMVDEDDKLGSYYALAGQIGMLDNDELNALDIKRPVVEIPKYFQMVPEVPVVISGDQQALQFIVGSEPTGAIELTQVYLHDSLRTDQGPPQPMQTELRGFDSGGVEGIAVPDEGDTPGLHAFWEAYYVDQQPPPNQGQLHIELDVLDLVGETMELEPHGDGSFVDLQFEPGDTSFEGEFIVLVPGIGRQFFRFETETDLEQPLFFEFAEVHPVLSGPGQRGLEGMVAISALDMFIGFATGGPLDPFLPLFSTTMTAAFQVNGDFDGDGDVDGTDFLAWQLGFGITSGADLTDGDADGDGDVDGEDFLIWQEHFGVSLSDLGDGGGGSRSAAAIPEPSALLLGITVLAAFASRRRSREPQQAFNCG